MKLIDELRLGPQIERSIATMLNSPQVSWFGFLSRQGGYSAELIRQADQGRALTLDVFFGRWIESGRSGQNGIVDTPSDRNVEAVTAEFDEPLSAQIFAWLARNPPMPEVSRSGEASLHYPIPDYTRLNDNPWLVGYDHAVWWFITLMASPHRYRLARCFNQKCFKYFTYSRNPRTSIKNGTFCPACEAAASVLRTNKFRDEKKLGMLVVASDAWQRWKQTRSHPDQREWVVQQVNQKCGTDIKRKWVTQNLGKILEKVEANQNG